MRLRRWRKSKVDIAVLQCLALKRACFRTAQSAARNQSRPNNDSVPQQARAPSSKSDKQSRASAKKAEANLIDFDNGAGSGGKSGGKDKKSDWDDEAWDLLK